MRMTGLVPKEGRNSEIRVTNQSNSPKQEEKPKKKKNPKIPNNI